MCDQHFYEKDKLEKHVNSHTNSKPYACLVCKKTYNSNVNLARHACSQKETPYSCPIASCAKTFKTSTEAIDHQHTHDNVPAFTCLAKLKHKQFCPPPLYVQEMGGDQLLEIFLDLSEKCSKG
jgi:uncharacterized Zn-finger protein